MDETCAADPYASRVGRCESVIAIGLNQAVTNRKVRTLCTIEREGGANRADRVRDIIFDRK